MILLSVGFPKRCWSFHISFDISSWWSRPYTNKSRPCDCSWSCLEPQVLFLVFLSFFFSF